MKDCIQIHNDELKFQEKCGVSVGSFLELLSVYLSSTIIGWKGDVYTQRSGVCIGSSVAPILSEIFLSSVDRDLESALDGIVVKMFRYVDDYLVLLNSNCCVNSRVNVLKIFKDSPLSSLKTTAFSFWI